MFKSRIFEMYQCKTLLTSLGINGYISIDHVGFVLLFNFMFRILGCKLPQSILRPRKIIE